MSFFFSSGLSLPFTLYLIEIFKSPFSFDSKLFLSYRLSDCSQDLHFFVCLFLGLTLDTDSKRRNDSTKSGLELVSTLGLLVGVSVSRRHQHHWSSLHRLQAAPPKSLPVIPYY